MATRRRKANWILPLGEENVVEKRGCKDNEGRVGAGDVILFVAVVKRVGSGGAGRVRCFGSGCFFHSVEQNRDSFYS